MRIGIIQIVNHVNGGAAANYGLWRRLQEVSFNDIQSLSDIGVELSQWNAILREACETLDTAKDRLFVVHQKQFEAYNAINEFIVQLLKVISRCLLRLGQLAPPANP